jgi:hypothetical protein
MGQAEDLRVDAQDIIESFGNIALACDYLAVPGDPDYFPESGQHVWHDVPDTLTAVPMIFTDYDQHERQNSAILPDDERALLASLDLTDTTPKVGHLLRKPDGSIWSVVAVGTDPATAHWDLQIRSWPSTSGWPV